MRSEYLMPHWQEGMLLKPQHFQSFSRYLENRDNRHIQTSHPFYWGVRELDISSDEISNEMISIRKASLYLRDGTLLLIPDEGEPPARNFKKALDESAGSLDVFLTIPRRQHSLPVVGPDTNARYRIIQNECEDENTGSNSVMLEYCAFNTKLLFGNEAAHGSEKLPIARIRYSSDQSELPEMDPGFAPPCVDVQAVPALKGLMNDAVHLLSGKSRDLAQQLVHRHVSFGTDATGDSESLLKLHVANSNLPALSQLTTMRGIHPFTVYQYWSRLVGELSIFTPERRVPDLEPYDHENPVRSLGALLDVIRGTWSGPDTRFFEKRDFTKVAEGLSVDLDEAWMDQELDLYLGVESAIAADEVNQVMQTNIRMGELSDMGNFKRFNIIGLGRTLVKSPPAVLPQKDGLHYFKIERRGNFWDTVKSKRNLTLGYLGESDDLILRKLKTPETDLFNLYVVLRVAP